VPRTVSQEEINLVPGVNQPVVQSDRQLARRGIRQDADFVDWLAARAAGNDYAHMAPLNRIYTE
jgi:hypothetical protein